MRHDTQTVWKLRNYFNILGYMLLVMAPITLLVIILGIGVVLARL